MTAVRQTSFGGGELSPYLWGRTDSPLYGKGLRRCRDFFITRHGMAVSRPGTIVCDSTKKNWQQAGSSLGNLREVGHSRLLPFIAGDNDAYVLEFGDYYVRFFQRGVHVQVATAPNVLVDGYLEIVSPYWGDELVDLQYAQVGDVLTLTHPAHPPMELRRTNGVWEFFEINYEPVHGQNELGGLWRNIKSGGVTRPPMLVNSTESPIFTPDAGHIGKPWVWRVTAILENTETGQKVESTPFRVGSYWEYGSTSTWVAMSTLAGFPVVPPPPVPQYLTEGGFIMLAPDRPVTIRRLDDSSVSPQPQPTGWKVLTYNYYRGEGSLNSVDGLYGFIGTSDALDFVDIGRDPDYSLQPPRGTNPFVVTTDSSGTVTRLDNPTAITFFEERRCFGGLSPSRPHTVLLSGSGNYLDYDKHTIPVSGESLLFELAARRRETIHSMVGLRRLLVLTDASVWSLGGSNGPVDFDSVQAQVEDEVGASTLRPLVLDGVVLYARTKGLGVRGLQYDGAQTTFQGSDISWHAQHLFSAARLDTEFAHFGSGGSGTLYIRVKKPAAKLVDWAYAEDPWSLVWAVREDGALLSASYTRDGTAAWSQHNLAEGGLVKSICVIPEDNEDSVYMVVQRGNLTLVERFASRQQDDLFLDGIAVDCAWPVQLTLPFTESQGMVTYTWAMNTADNPYEGKDVWVVAKGMAPQGPFRVTNSQVTFQTPPGANFDTSIWVGYIGFLFQPEIETLDVVSSDTRTKQKTVVSVGFEVDQSRGLMVGQDFEHLTEWRQRRVADNFSPVSASTDLVVVPVKGTYDRHARAVLRQTLPLPVTVLGVTREVDVGG